MRCKCGYVFSQAKLQALRAGKEAPYESYLVVDDKDFMAFIRAELRVLQCEDQKTEAYYSAIGRAAALAGSLMKCPMCSCLLLVKPGDASLESFTPEA